MNVTGAGTADRLAINLMGGNDTFDASTLPPGSMSLFAEGGTGNDSLTGGDGADHLRGDTGDDVLSGGRGADLLDGGAGTDQLNGGPDINTGLGGESSDSVEK